MTACRNSDHETTLTVLYFRLKGSLSPLSQHLKCLLIFSCTCARNKHFLLAKMCLAFTWLYHDSLVFNLPLAEDTIFSLMCIKIQFCKKKACWDNADVKDTSCPWR